MMKSIRWFIVLAVVGVLFSAVCSWSAFEFNPYLTLQEEYNDNIFLTDVNAEKDWITTVEPGIIISYNNRSVAATINYSLRYRFYKDNSAENQDQFREVQRANASALFFAGRPFTLSLSETISREALDERDRDTDFNELVNRTTVYQTTIVPEYRFQFTPTFSLVFGYSYDRFDYVDSRGNDSEEHQGRFSLVKQLSAATDVFARYAYTVHQSDAAADEFDRHDYTLGLNQEFGGRTSVSLEVGYSEIEYDSGFTTDIENWLATISYQLSEPVTLSLRYLQDFVVTAEDGVTETQEAGFGVEYVKESLLTALELFWNNSDYVRQDREDKAYGVRIDVSRQLARAVTFNIDAEYEQAEYTDPGINEEVDRLTFGTSLDYEYRRFLVSLGYRYRTNKSDVDTNEYTNNIINLSATVRF